MGCIHFTNYKGVRILEQAFCGADKEELIYLLSESKKHIEKEPLKSVLVLTNIECVHFDIKALDHFELIAAQNRDYVKASAVYGVNDRHIVAIESIGEFTRREFKIFSNREDALEWLIDQG